MQPDRGLQFLPYRGSVDPATIGLAALSMPCQAQEEVGANRDDLRSTLSIFILHMGRMLPALHGLYCFGGQ